VGPYGFDATAEICTSVSLLCNVGNYNVYIHGVLSFRFCHWCRELPNPRAKAVFLGARDMNGGLYHNSFSLLYFISKFISGVRTVAGKKTHPTNRDALIISNCWCLRWIRFDGCDSYGISIPRPWSKPRYLVATTFKSGWVKNKRLVLSFFVFVKVRSHKP